MIGGHWQLDDYRFGYQGSEKDPEMKGDANSYTMEFRQYDPRLGRWLSLDPMMMQFPWMSPYVGFDDNPVFFTDPYGLSPTDPGDGNKKGKDGGSIVEKGAVTTIENFWDYSSVENVMYESKTVNPKTGKIQYNLSEFVATPKPSQFNIEGLAVTLLGSAAVSLEATLGAAAPYAVAVGLAGAAIYIGKKAADWCFDPPAPLTVPYPDASPNPINDITGTRPVSEPISVPFAIPFDWSDDQVDLKPGDDGMVTLFRGVPSVTSKGLVNPAYEPACAGIAVPQGGDAGPADANMGVPSKYTFWTTNPWIAHSFATRKGTTNGIILVTRLPWGEIMPNTSPDKFNQGEIQIKGEVQGVPVPVD